MNDIRKRKIAIIVSFVIIFVCITAVITFILLNTSDITQFNRFSRLDFKIGELADTDGIPPKGGYEKDNTVQMFGGSVYKSADGFVQVTISMFPDCTYGKPGVTQISTSRKDDTVLGITIGDDVKDICKLLKRYNYIITNDNETGISANNGKICVSFEFKDGVISLMSVSVRTSNVKGIVY